MGDEHHLAPAVDLDERLDPRLQNGEVVVAPLRVVWGVGWVCEPTDLQNSNKQTGTDLHVVQREAPVVGREDEVAVVVPNRREVSNETGPNLLWRHVCTPCQGQSD